MIGAAGRGPGRAAAIAVLCAMGFACGPAGSKPVAADAWSRATVAAGDADPGEPAGPGVIYLRLRNSGTEPDVLLGARSEICETIEIHETRMRGDRMSMAHVERLTIAAGDAIEFRPGAHHLMLFGLKRHLRGGDRFRVELDFERHGPLEVQVEVRAP